MQLTSDQFRGYIQPTTEELQSALAAGVVVLDTNVLLALYSVPDRPRQVALRFLRELGGRLWLPHQVAVEFWRSRPAKLVDLRTSTKSTESFEALAQARIRQLSLSGQLDDDGRPLAATITEHAQAIDAAFEDIAGSYIDASIALKDPLRDPLLVDLEEIFGDRVGEPFAPSEYDALVKEGLARFALRRPPGYKDAGAKKDQIPEHGTGDFLMWEQTLRYVESMSPSGPFTLISGDFKEDWRLIAGGTDIGPRPELVAEAVSRTGHSVHLISPQVFYALLAAGQSPEVQAAAEELSKSVPVTSEEPRWTLEGLRELLRRLREAGYTPQADVIVAAARAGGEIDRTTLFAVAGFAADRKLSRFSTPANRIAGELIDEGILEAGVLEPVWALYDGPGQAVAYEVTPEFCDLVDSLE